VAQKLANLKQAAIDAQTILNQLQAAGDVTAIEHAKALATAHQQLAGATEKQIEQGALYIEQAEKAKKLTDDQVEGINATIKAGDDADAEREKSIRSLGIEADLVRSITLLGSADTKARAEQIAVLQRQAELRKEGGILTDIEADAIRRLADAQFDAEHRTESLGEALESAFQRFRDNARENSQLVQNGFDIAFNGMTDALDNFVETGKLKVKSMVRSMIGDFAKLASNWAFNQLLGMLLGGIGGPSLGGGGAAVLGSTGIPGLMTQGGVHHRAASGMVIPGMHPTRISRNVTAGEGARDEGVLPLRRMPSGELGVQAQGAGGGITINAPVSVTVNGERTRDEAEAVARATSAGVENMVVTVLQREMRSGGLLGPKAGGIGR
jgi:lambda family phage tail tape measure protein